MPFSALDSALTGPLFATPDMAAVFTDRARIAAMIEVETALADALEPLGLAAPGLAAALRAVSPEGFDLGALGASTAIAGVPTIPFLKALEAQLPEEVRRGFHLGATTQDVLDTALVLQLRRALDLLRADMCGTIEGLARLAERHRATPCAGRTYGQHAAPVTFGYKAAVWATGLAEAAARWPQIRAELGVLSLAGPVGTGAGWGFLAGEVQGTAAARLGLVAEPVPWHALRGRLADAGAWIARLLGALGKMAADIAHLASTEVGEVAEPHVPGRGGSSAMPHKRNPVGATVILAAASAAKGPALTLIDAMVAGHERPAGAWHAEWHALPQLFGLASGALQEARILADGLVVDEGRMAANLGLTKGMLFADRIAAELVPTLGRAGAHEAVERAADAVRRGEAASLFGALRADPALRKVPSPKLDGALDATLATEAAAAVVDAALPGIRAVLETLRPDPT